MRYAILTLIALLVQGCAHVRPAEDGGTEVSYTGGSRGAARLLRAGTTDKVANTAAEQGLPVSLNMSDTVTNVATGGMYGHSVYGDGYGAAPDVIQSGPSPAGFYQVRGMGGLPVLGATNSIGGVIAGATIDPNARCPSDTAALRSVSEELACQRETDAWQTQQIRIEASR